MQFRIPNLAKDFSSLINKASTLLGCLRDIVWSNSYMHTENKIKIYKTRIKQIMTNDTEVREDTNKTESMLRVAEVNTENNNEENKERQSEKHRHQRAMRNTRYSETGKAA